MNPQAVGISDVQVLSMALAVIIPLSMLLYSNSRISDTKETLRAEIAEAKQTLRLEMKDARAEVQAMRAEMKAGFEVIATALKVHELEHHK